jgi:steroid delta-isomerase-like uncharacterized protein
VDQTTKIIDTPEFLMLTVLNDLKNGQIEKAVDEFADKFKFTDHGIGLEFDSKERLSEFFTKTRELYPDAQLKTEAIFVNGEDVVIEWAFRATASESFFGALKSRRIPVAIRGVSVVRTEDGKITRWSEYYDGLTARRTALSSYFTDWAGL